VTHEPEEPRRSRRWVLRAGASAAAAGIGVSEFAGAGTAAASALGARLPAVKGPARVPSTEQIMKWIATIVEQGIRRPAYPADRWIEGWGRDRFEQRGLDDVHLERVDVTRWNPGKKAELVVGRDRYRGFQLPYTAAGPVAADLVIMPSPDEIGAVDGRIGVTELKPITLPQNLARDTLATAYVDPGGALETLQQILPFDGKFNEVMDPALDAGAVGFVGLLTGFPWETHDYYVPYDGKLRAAPGLWLNNRDGRRLLDGIANGATSARIEVDGEHEPARSHNVVGTLPGASDEWVIVASHHDGPWASAVEDASGVSLVLAQAAYWSKVPARQRPHNMMFVLMAGHMFGGKGTATFVEQHADELERVVLEVHLEHAARRSVGENGKLVPTEDPEVRWWFTSESPTLVSSVQQALTDEGLARSLILRPDVFFEAPPTDGAAFHLAGVPLVQFLTAPMYLFDSRDTIDKIHEPSLEPVSRAVVKIIESTRGVSAAEMRAGITPTAGG
jgi:hypothetical protein